MSKSKGNVVSPVEMIEEHGADALRYALVNGVSAGADSEFSEGKLENGRRFVNKLWNIGRFALAQVEARPEALAGPIDQAPAGTGLTEADRWILSRTEAAVEELTRLIEHYQFGEYATALQQFVWTEVADVYVELAKPQRRPAGSEDAAVRTLAYVLDRVLRLAHPSIPFVTETLALQLRALGRTSDAAPSLVVSAWPKPGARDAALEDRFGLAIEVIRRIRERRQEADVDPRTKVRVALGGDAEALRPFADIIASLTTADVRFGGGDAAPTLVRAVEVRVDVPRDTAGDRARLEKELEEALKLLEHSRTLLGSDFAKRAPAAVVEKARATLAEREAAVASLKAELGRAG
jgi:valyl-tRNA synthetase